jgi:hypothetical protein
VLPRQGPAGHAAPAPGTPLALEQVSALLWAGVGRSRPGSGGRAPVAGTQVPPVVLYAQLPQGAYRYDAREHRLLLLAPRDLRTAARTPGAQRPTMELVYVWDQRCLEDPGSEECGVLGGADVASIADQVGAYCASAGLEASAQEHADPRLAAALRLAPGERIAYVQAVHPLEPAAH